MMRALALFVVLLLAACKSNDGAPPPEAAPPPGQLVRSDKARLDLTAAPADTSELTGDDADFAFDVLRRAAGHDNFFVSPHSMSIALAMTYAGARGSTATQMAQALHFTLPADRLHATFGALDLALARRAEKPVDSGKAFELSVVNALFAQRGYQFLSSFLDLLAEDYGAGVSLLDFAADAEGSRTAINGWVSDRTKARIPELLAKGVITSETVLVLTNAIYFKASWTEPFDPNDTTDAPFTTPDGATKPARFMHQNKERPYGEGDGWQAVELPYVGDDVSMLVVLPAAGTLDALVKSLDAKKLAAIASALGGRLVDLRLPRFEFRTQLGMKPVLRALGMTDAFEGGTADFSGMDGTRSLFIEDVVHEAWISVDEDGTEAAAATAAVVGRVSAPERATFTADRPFLVVIRDRPTGAVLFVGQVTSP